MEWWPVANGEAWTWAWRAYPAVWLFIATLGGAYVLLVRAEQERARLRGEAGVEGWRVGLFASGLALLWVSLDWPLGAMAAGYLATANAAQDLLVTLGAAPLMLLGLPPSRDRPRQPLSLAGRVRSLLGQPIIAAVVFGVILMVTHLPGVVDALRPHALGSFAITSAWLLSAVVLWTPLAGPLAGRHRLPYFGALVFLAVPFVFPKIAGAFFVFADRPLYEVYTNAPRMFDDVSAMQDQHAAGFVLWVIGSLMVVAALGALFRRWYTEDRRIAAPPSLEIPADPRAVDLLFEVPGGWAALEQLVASVEQALPRDRSGTALAFGYRDRVEDAAQPAAGDDPGVPPTQVILELHIALGAAAEAGVAQRIEADYGAYLGRQPRRRRDAIARALAFRVVGYGSRVS
ncbi:MAG: cytochrome c oxidase assembly protein [Chloroflexi bacterium]|nr:cytochrome c oxidase assembly protein [Chloroflexota bacterium]